MAPFLFLSLPTEVQTKIIRYLLPGVIVPEWRGEDSVIALGERVATHNLKSSCTQIRDIVEQIRPIDATNRHRRVQFSFDPDCDTLMVWDMCLPRMNYVVNWSNFKRARLGLDEHALPIRRLLTSCRDPELPRDFDSIQHLRYLVMNGIDDPAKTNPWRALPFSTSFPILSRFPRIQEFVISVQSADSQD
ncbi:hypothetical protein ACHAPJ_011974 [Fusarium lateritium]